MPGESVPPEPTVTDPETVPLPPSDFPVPRENPPPRAETSKVAPGETITDDEARLAAAPRESVPASTNVAPA